MRAVWRANASSGVTVLGAENHNSSCETRPRAGSCSTPPGPSRHCTAACTQSEGLHDARRGLGVPLEGQRHLRLLCSGCIVTKGLGPNGPFLLISASCHSQYPSAPHARRCRPQRPWGSSSASPQPHRRKRESARRPRGAGAACRERGGAAGRDGRAKHASAVGVVGHLRCSSNVLD